MGAPVSSSSRNKASISSKRFREILVEVNLHRYSQRFAVTRPPPGSLPPTRSTTPLRRRRQVQKENLDAGDDQLDGPGENQSEPTDIFEWCGIPLDSAFRCATNRAVLVPSENSGVFKNPTHEHRYTKLVKVLTRELARLRMQQRDDIQAEKAQCNVDRAEEAHEFHNEFLGRLSWGKPGTS